MMLGGKVRQGGEVDNEETQTNLKPLPRYFEPLSVEADSNDYVRK